MDDAVSLRLATESDAPSLARMRFAFRASFGPTTEDEAAFIERCTAWMRDALADGAAWRCWVAVADGDIIGHLWLQLIEKIPNPIVELERHAYITNVFVLPDARSRGTGRRLIEAALAFCREQGVDSVLLWPSQRSRPLYERLGFAPPSDVLEQTVNGGRKPH